jgi:hypothetical protein
LQYTGGHSDSEITLPGDSTDKQLKENFQTMQKEIDDILAIEIADRTPGEKVTLDHLLPIQRQSDKTIEDGEMVR